MYRNNYVKERKLKMKRKQYMLPDYTFICPVCREYDVALARTGVVYTQIVDVHPRYGVEWGDPEFDEENYEDSWFECMRCGYKVEKNGQVISGDDFDSYLEWVQENNGSLVEEDEQGHQGPTR
jgi:hypothetical protein